MQLFRNIEKARFVSRPNRFTCVCTFKGRPVKAYLPNPGRLHELLLPGSSLYLERSGSGGRSTALTVVAVDRGGLPVLLHTQRTNDIAQYLIQRGLVPGLEGARILKREVKKGPSRFDFLLEKRGERVLLEVKSCTLFSRTVAMFPDAVTERGRRHVEELSELSGHGTVGEVLFIVNNPNVKFFMPDFHTDLAFARTLLGARDRIKITPLSIRLNSDLSLSERVRLLAVPWDIIEREAGDRGAYIIVLKLSRPGTIDVGGLGRVSFKKGFYIYVGSARKGLGKRILRHRRRIKRPFWHIDYLRGVCEFLYSLPVRTSDDIECHLAGEILKLSDRYVHGFGSSDCNCPSHLFATREDPMHSKRFHELLEHFRMERLVTGAAQRSV